MNALKVFAIILSLALVFSFSACSKPSEQPAPPKAPAPPVEKAPEPAKPTDANAAASMMGDQTGIMADLGKLIEAWVAKPTDFKVLTERYQPNLSKYVQEADKKYGTNLDKEIMAALKEGAEGKYTAGNRQIIQKGIQMAFVMNFESAIKAIGEGKSSPETIAQVKESAPSIKMIAGRRDKGLEKGNEYTGAFDAIYKKLEAADKADDAAAVKAASDEMLAFVTKMTLLSVFHEIKGLEHSRGKEGDDAETKFEESRMYYRSLIENHKKRNAEGAATIEGQFNKKPEEVDTDLIQGILAADYKQEIAGLDPKKLGM